MSSRELWAVDLIEPSPWADLFDHPEDHIARLVEDIAERGIQTPLHVVPRGGDRCELVTGHDRLEAARRLGLDDVPVEVRRDLADEDERFAHFAKDNNLRKTGDKRRVAEHAIRQHPEWSDSRLAKWIGVSHPFIGQVRADLEAAGLVVTVTTRVGLDGVEQPARKPPSRPDRSYLPRRCSKCDGGLLDTEPDGGPCWSCVQFGKRFTNGIPGGAAPAAEPSVTPEVIGSPPEVETIVQTSADLSGNSSEGLASAVRIASEEARDVETVSTRRPPASRPKPIPDPESEGERAFKKTDLADEFERVLKENDQLRAQVEALQSDDISAELAKWMEKFARLDNYHQGVIRTKNEVENQATRATSLLAKIRKVLGVERNSQILPRLTEVLQ